MLKNWLEICYFCSFGCGYRIVLNPWYWKGISTSTGCLWVVWQSALCQQRKNPLNKVTAMIIKALVAVLQWSSALTLTVNNSRGCCSPFSDSHVIVKLCACDIFKSEPQTFGRHFVFSRLLFRSLLLFNSLYDHPLLPTIH